MANQPNSAPDNPSIQSLNSRIASLQTSANRWSAGYLWVTGLAVVVAATALYAQFKALDFTRKLSIAQSELDGLKDRQSETRIAELYKSAADANLTAGQARERAAEAEKHLADANARAAEAEKMAEGEHLERIKLEEKIAWRRLTVSQQRDIAFRLRRFAGEIGDCLYRGNDMEAFTFSSDIAAALREAGWRAIPPSQAMSAMKMGQPPTAMSPIERVDTGVQITSTADRNSVSAARAVEQELQRLGFDAEYKSTEENQSSSRVWIVVQHRPDGPQGEAKLKATNRP